MVETIRHLPAYALVLMLYPILLSCGNSKAPLPRSEFQRQLQNARLVVHQKQASAISYMALEDGAVALAQNRTTRIASFSNNEGAWLQQSGDYLLQYNPTSFSGVKVFLGHKQIAAIECSAFGTVMFAEYDGSHLYLGGAGRDGIFVQRYDQHGKQLAAQQLELPDWDSPTDPMPFSRLVDRGLQLVVPMADLVVNLNRELVELSRVQLALPEYLLINAPHQMAVLTALKDREDELKAYYQEHRGEVFQAIARGCYFQEESCFLVFELVVLGDYSPASVDKRGATVAGVYPCNEIVSISSSTYQIEAITRVAENLRFAGRQQNQLVWWNSPTKRKRTGVRFQTQNPVW